MFWKIVVLYEIYSKTLVIEYFLQVTVHVVVQTGDKGMLLKKYLMCCVQFNVQPMPWPWIK